MKIIKRNGSEVIFDITKIIIAITKANDTVEEADRMTPVQIQRIAESVELQCQKMNRAPTVEEIQDMVEHHIMAHGAFEVAKSYITYRYTRSLVRKSNTTKDRNNTEDWYRFCSSSGYSTRAFTRVPWVCIVNRIATTLAQML